MAVGQTRPIIVSLSGELSIASYDQTALGSLDPILDIRVLHAHPEAMLDPSPGTVF
jgi:hypothetical protein